MPKTHAGLLRDCTKMVGGELKKRKNNGKREPSPKLLN